MSTDFHFKSIWLNWNQHFDQNKGKVKEEAICCSILCVCNIKYHIPNFGSHEGSSKYLIKNPIYNLHILYVISIKMTYMQKSNLVEMISGRNKSNSCSVMKKICFVQHNYFFAPFEVSLIITTRSAKKRGTLHLSWNVTRVTNFSIQMGFMWEFSRDNKSRFQ